ncbi:DNA-entry nuclease [Companilactobacillus nuruki]|uniref:DNA-entry nuclease n=1 Tax=Companilactobacillus nuruki TaxID=1993540 RepID=A0A2N7AWH0_9LACO|nr:DNA-entry nuclease [Companilactobacillus nuruki]PMD73094.1 DNA-entry nuclease [Companilactobacillus nuruki]
MTDFISFLAFIALCYFGVKIFKYRKTKVKNRNELALRKKYQIGLFISILVMLVFAGIGGSNDKTDTSSKKSADTAKVVKKKYVGKDDYKIAKKENVALIAKEKKLSDQEEKLQEQKDQISSDEAKAKEREQQQAAAAQKQQEQQAKEAQKQQEQAQSQQQSQQATQTRGDMNTGDTGTIVGNSNSHIYHVPGQRGYNMNSSNAVYFKTEQDAINAGYRRSKV